MNITLDGFMASADQGMEWHFRYWNEEMADEASFRLSHADTILLGRKTYEAMAAWWPAQLADPHCPRTDIAFAEMMHYYRKIVFSRTLPRARWNNSIVVREEMQKEIAQLKTLPGKDLISFGSGSLVAALMDSGLIDEYQLWLHPVVLGSGIPFITDEKAICLVEEKRFATGVVLRGYRGIGSV